jgi:hypothetical protein
MNKREWQPIATLFPQEKAKEDSILLFTNRRQMAMVFWGYGLFNRKGKWCSLITRRPLDFIPTEWMELPWPDADGR